MKRIISLALVLILVLSVFPASAGNGFSSDASAINEAAKSVLLLEIYNSKRKAIATGSGFVGFNDSTLITNYHVIEGGWYVTAYDDDGKPYSVTKVLCADKESDIAILGFEKATGLKPLTLKAYSNLMRGETVVAIGSPKGYLNTVSTGIISALPEDNWIQFTAPISHGSSGGVLLNDQGEVIGITSAISKYEDAQNINYAINIAVAKAMYKAWNGRTYTISGHSTTARMDFTDIYETAAHSSSNTATTVEWACPNCGTRNSSQFCTECGSEKPSWVCKCGTTNSGKFCGSCGSAIADLIASANLAIAYEKAGNYESAIAEYKALSGFNSMSFVTDGGKNWVAKEHISAAYYAWADVCLEIMDFKSAVEYFESAGNYLDASSRVDGVYYAQGEYQLSQGRYDDALKSFGWAGKYKDAATRILMCYYAKGEALLQEGDYNGAAGAFKSAGSYGDAADRIKECRYEQGIACIAKGEYDAGITAFKAAGKYKDAETMILSIYYLQAQTEMESGNYKKAEEFFKKAGNYSDASEQAKLAEEMPTKIKYDDAVRLMESGEYLRAAQAFEKLGAYKDSQDNKNKCNYEYGCYALEQKNYDVAYTYFIKAGKYADALDRAYESRIQKAKDQFESQRYTRVRESLKDVLFLSEAEDLYNKATYAMAEDYAAKKNYPSAISYYNECIDYADSKDKLLEARSLYYVQLIKGTAFDKAYSLYTSELKSEHPLEDAVVVESGDKGYAARQILVMANKMGFIEWISETQEEYSSKYTSSIKRMETNFGMNADGTITLTEYHFLANVYYPGVKSSDVSKLLERISDLGYMDAYGKLPDDHSVYESKYSYCVTNLERALGLKADGFLTEEERAVILKQKVENVGEIANFNVTASSGIVTLSWSQAKGAKWYEVYRGNKLIATQTGTYYTDKEAEQGATVQYQVKACKYSKSTQKTKSIKVEPVYTWRSVKDLCKDKSNLNKYIIVENLVKLYHQVKGEDIRVFCSSDINGKQYGVILIYENYPNWTGQRVAARNKGAVITSCKGQVIDYVYSSELKQYIPYIRVESVTWKN